MNDSLKWGLKFALLIFPVFLVAVPVFVGVVDNKESSVVQWEEEEQVVSPTPITMAPYDCEVHIECRELARTVYWEARGEPLAGQIAVAHVVLNRVKAPYWKGGVIAVIHTKCHFEYLCIQGLMDQPKDSKAWEKAKDVAEGALFGYYKDNTFGANHYLAKKKLTRLPKWARVYKETVTIGNHTFYKRG